MKMRAAVIGLGKIGQGYDYDTKRLCLTHAQAFHQSKYFDLVGGVDLNTESRVKFESKFRQPTFAKISDLFKEVKPQVVALATPTFAHYETFCQVMDNSPRAVICEKPLTYSVREAEDMVKRAENITLLVNYMRRFEPGVLEMKNQISKSRMKKGRVLYSKGLYNGASHFIDLTSFLFGTPTGVELVEKGRVADFDPRDLEPRFKIKFADAWIEFIPESGDLAEMEFDTEAGKFEYKSTGEKILFNGHEIPNDSGRYQYHVLNGLVKAMKEKVPPTSNGETALATLKVVDQIHKLVKGNVL